MLLSVVKRAHFIKRICQSIYQRVKGLKDVLDEKMKESAVPYHWVVYICPWYN